MKLTILGSSSSGNCYLIHNDNECLIIEAGIRLQDVKKAIDFKTSIIKGCISSHVHGDHSKYIEQYAKAGIPVYGHETVFEMRNQHHNYHFIRERKSFKVGGFRVLPLPLTHDVPCFGFYINHPDTGNFCFITDTAEVNYKFKELNHVLIECNYDRELIDTNETLYQIRDRVITSHLSLEQCVDFLNSNDLSQVYNVVLLHASDFNSDTRYFKRKVESVFNKSVYVAEKGLKIDLNNSPF